MPPSSSPNREVLETIRDHGWCAVHVRAGPADEGEGGARWRPDYAYSIGFGLTRRWPEAAIFGLSLEHARGALWRLWELERDPAALSDGARLDGVLKDRSVVVRRVSATRFDAYFSTGLKTYVSLAEFGRMRMLQLVYPDHDGRFPWDAGCDPRFRRAQPALHDGAARAASDFD